MPESVACARRWASRADVAAHLKVTPRSVQNWTDDGTLKAYRVGPRLVRYDLDEVDAAVRPAEPPDPVARLADHARRVAESLPPLTEKQISQIVALLRPAPGSGRVA